MIKDFQLLKDISPLFEKKIIIWGFGNNARIIINDLYDMGAGQKGIFICDSDNNLWDKKISGNVIFSPEKLKTFVECKFCLTDFIALVAVASIKNQNEILSSIEKLYGRNILDVYTIYSIKLSIFFNIKSPYINKSYRNKILKEHEQKRINYKEPLMQKMDALKYFAFLPLHNDEILLIYQPGKVASSSIYNSLINYKKNALQVHVLSDIGQENDLYNILNIKSGKIISLVREPVIRQISAMWQNLSNVDRYEQEVNFTEIENLYFVDGFENEEFEWFDREIKKVFCIDVFEHPFDKEKGYEIIKEGKIELLLLKMEKLMELEDVIGEFLDIPQFKLQNTNIGNEKFYRFAYREYIIQFFIPYDRLQEIYKKNRYLKHFYTEDELNIFYNKWLDKKLERSN